MPTEKRCRQSQIQLNCVLPVCRQMPPTVLEICAGAGGQAIGLEAAGFGLAGAVEIDRHACETLRLNRRAWNVIQASVVDFDGLDYRGIDLLAGGVPCPPFSIAGKQLGHADERNLFPEAMRLVRETKPRAVMLENVPGFASDKFAYYRRELFQEFTQLGYESEWRVLNACWFGVPQLRPRFVLVAFKGTIPALFSWPEAFDTPPATVGDTLVDLMSSRNWRGAAKWRLKASSIAPTLVGGSKKHGGPDLGPTRARRQWAAIGVDGIGIADEAPGPNFAPSHTPRLTVRMTARLQGFPDSWFFCGGKTAAYRQVGNAFPPPVAQAVGQAIQYALRGKMPHRKYVQPALFRTAVNA